MRDYLKDKYATIVGNMESKKDLSADEEKALKAAIENWKKSGSF
jgi:F-type H+-transporting ATPase subunit alpha